MATLYIIAVIVWGFCLVSDMTDDEENELLESSHYEMTEAEIAQHIICNDYYQITTDPVDVIRQIKEGKIWTYKGVPIRIISQ